MKKFFITLMCIVMVVCFMPTVALATCTGGESCTHVAAIGMTHYGTLKEAFEASNSGDTIVMLKDFENADVSKSVDFSLKDGVTLNGNGHEIRGNSSVHMCTAANGTSTIMNVTFKYIHNNSNASQSDCNWYGWENGKQGTKSAIYASSLQGTANIVDCTFDNADWDAIQMTPKAGATINITGNTFSHSSTEDYSQLRYIHMEARSASGTSIESNRAANITITNNKFYNTCNTSAEAITNIGIWGFAAAGLNVSGNWFESTKNVEISSSSSGNGLAYKIYPARSQADVDSDDLYPVAYNGSTTYNTLQDAINSTVSSVYLMQDNAENITIPKGRTITIYPKTFKMTGDVTNNGTVTIYSGTNLKGTAVFTNNGTLSLSCDAATGFTVNNNGTLKITAGSIYNLSKIINAEGATVSITGGTFNAKPDNTWVADLYIANGNEDSTYTVRKMTADQAADNGKKVASSTSSSSAIYYSSVEAGIADGKTTLYLVADYTEAITIPAGKSLTLNANGKNLTGVVTNNGTLTLKDPAQVVNNGTLTLKGPAQVENNGILKITGGATYDVSKIINAASATVAITGGTFNAQPDDAWIAFGYRAKANDGDNTFTVEKVTMTDEGAMTAGAVARYNTATKDSREYYDTLQAAVIAHTGSIYLLKDVNENISSINKIDVYFDNYTFTGTMTSGSTIWINDGTAILNNVKCETFKAGYGTRVANITVKDGSAADIIVYKNANLTIEGGTYTGSLTMTEDGTGSLTIKGGTFSSDVSQYIPENYVEYAMRNGTYIVKANDAAEPAFTTGNYWSDLNGKVYTELYSAPYIPPTPTAPTDNVTNSGTSGTDNATTSADLSNTTSTSNGTTAATVDKTTADKIVDKAVENKSTEVVIDATANSTAAADSTTIAQVTIPTETLGAIAEKTEADVTIKTDVAEVKMDNAAAAAVSEQAEGDTVKIIAEKVKEDATEVHFELKVVCSDGKVISDFKGGNIAVTVALPKAMAEKKVVCVYIDDNGHMSKVEGQKNADGTYTFFTGHFSTYAILAEEEADAAIAEQTEAIKNIEIKVSTKLDATKAGKKGIKVTWKTADGKKLDGVEFFRSVKKNSGYGKKAFFTSRKAGTTGYYLNTKSLKKGTRYYYRVRGYVLVDGQKVYTDWSNKGIRTFK